MCRVAATIGARSEGDLLAIASAFARFNIRDVLGAWFSVLGSREDPWEIHGPQKFDWWAAGYPLRLLG